LPRCPQIWAPITIEHLLTHTAGLFNPANLTEADAAALVAKLGRPTPAQLAEVTAGWPLDFPPGSQWNYGNSDYWLLGYIIELVSGQDYGTFLRQEILDPLAMKDTGYLPDPADRHVIATGYANWSTMSASFDPTLAYSAGGLYSTVNDLAHWNQFLLTADPPVVSRDTLAQLLRPRVQAHGQEHCAASSAAQTCASGYGIYVGGTPDNPIWFHTGLFAGFVSRNEIHPDKRLSVTILSNLATANFANISDTLFRLAG
jgi:D-alanyl-D-alanine carboxypeptidase